MPQKVDILDGYNTAPPSAKRKIVGVNVPQSVFSSSIVLAGRLGLKLQPWVLMDRGCWCVAVLAVKVAAVIRAVFASQSMESSKI